jgi:hypothetical protein
VLAMAIIVFLSDTVFIRRIVEKNVLRFISCKCNFKKKLFPRDSRPRGPDFVAKSYRECFDLRARFFERAGAVDGFRGFAEFCGNRKLRGDALFCFRFGKAASKKSLELLFLGGPGDDEAIELFGETRFDQKCGFDENNIQVSVAFPLIELPKNGFADARVNDGVQKFDFFRVGKNDGAKFRAVDAGFLADNRGAECGKDFGVCGLTRFD